MDIHVFAGYVLILFLLIPSLLYAMMPLKDFLRYPLKRTVIIASVSLVGIILLLAAIGINAELTFKATLILALIPTLFLHLYLTRGKMLMRLFTFFNSTMITGNSMLYGVILAAPLEYDDSLLTLRPVSCLICLGVSAVLGIIYYVTLNRYLPYLLGSEHLDMDHRLALGITIFITVLFFWVMPRYAGVVMTGRVRITILTFLLLGPGAFMLVYRAMWRVAVNMTENAGLRESQELMAMERKRYEELRSYMDETRDLRHDFRQHLIVIDGYAKNGETSKLTDYISQFTESLMDHRSMIAANPALDAVASHYESVAESRGAHVKWLIELPRELPVREADFITVFGNLVENALIAVSALPEEKRIVHVHAKMLSPMMMGLTVSNPYEGRIELNKKGLPRSSKAGHGIGLSSVKAVVQRYNGTLDINTKNGEFTAGVLMYAIDQQ